MLLTLRAFRRAALGAAFAALAAAPVEAGDRFLSPGAGEALSPGAIVEVRWSPLCGGSRDREIDEAEIVLSLDGGRTFPVRVTPELGHCASRYLWKVPSLPSARARLALRSGLEERDATESLEILSAEFRILPDRDGRVEALRRRADEWWTPSDPAVLSAEDLLEKKMSSGGEEVRVPAGDRSAAVPTSFPSAVRPARRSERLAPARLEPVADAASAPARPAGAPTPLRL